MMTRRAANETLSWKSLEQYYDQNKDDKLVLKNLFSNDPDRFSKFTRYLDLKEANGGRILFDFSKNTVDTELLNLLFSLARETKVLEKRDDLFEGKHINFTEDRAVFHPALRNYTMLSMTVDGQDVMPEVRKTLYHMKEFSDNIRNGSTKGYTGKKIKSVVNIGIGGSDLGPVMVTEALKPYASQDIKVHFVSNIDGTHLAEALKECDPESTIFLVASKTFTTLETCTNAESAKKWLLRSLKNDEAIKHHFMALSTNEQEVSKFGIDPKNMFGFRDWVGGRYSVWSAIGLSICLSIGFDNFEKFLFGAHIVDKHFKETEFGENIPLIAGLINVFYSSIAKFSTKLIAPYDQYLHKLPAYLQQLFMESNGKHVDCNNDRVSFETGSVVWGEPGTNAQHSFFQLVHQGSRIIPTDFIIPAISQNPLQDGEHHRILCANFIAQTEALMIGRSKEQVKKENPNLSDDTALHKEFIGNRPTTSIILPKIDPLNLGALIAFYEWVAFVEGAVWGINSFDQFGVELGKVLAKTVLNELNSENSKISSHDSSTNGIINYLKNFN